jgi:hypothetical protein
MYCIERRGAEISKLKNNCKSIKPEGIKFYYSKHGAFQSRYLQG